MFIRHLPPLVRLLPPAVALLALLAFAPSSEAAFPGENGRLSMTSDVDCDHGLLNVVTFDPFASDSEPTGGDFDAIGRGEGAAWAPDGQRIAFEDFGDLATVNVDGTGYQPIGNGHRPAWSPDGERIAYQKLDGDIHVMNSDGSGDVTLTSDPAGDGAAAWSPDGSRIAFASERDGNSEIYVMDPDGGDQTRLTTNPGFDYAPNWSPDGSKIAFQRDSQIMVMNANGSGEAVIPSSSAGGGDPAWSPDGSKIAFTGDLGLYAMNADGSDVTLVYAACAFEPDWQPFHRGYVRPKGATPTRLSLVPASQACTSPDRTHGGPLAFPSCSPPSPASSNLTIGVGDGTPPAAKSIGSVELRALVGTPGPPDDADVAIAVRITNVMEASDNSDYTGELRLELPIRITDGFNTPSPSGYGIGTVSDTSFFATVPCAGTTDPALGSTCDLSVTADALLPGTVRQGARAIWGLGQVSLRDGGPDGDADTAGDNELFAVQGIFEP